MGSLSALKVYSNGGTFTSSIPIKAKFVFTRQSDSHVVNLPVDKLLDSSSAAWVHDVVDPRIEIDGCSDFHPGLTGQAWAEVPGPGQTCRDGLDNDCDGLTDCADVTDCCADPICGLCCTDEDCNDDGLFCTLDQCVDGVCSYGLGNPCPGPDGDDNCAESCDEDADNCSANDPDRSACYFGCQTDMCQNGECEGGPPCPPVPTVSSWGLGVVTLLVIVAGTIMLGRWRQPVEV